MDVPGEGSADVAQLGSEPHSGTALGRAVANRETYAGGWLLAQKSDNTRQAYRRDLVAFFAWIDEWRFDVFAMRRPHLDAYREYLTNHAVDGRPSYTPSSVARKISAIASFYTYLVDEGVMPANPARKVARPAVSDESLTAGLDLDEAGRLEWHADRAGIREGALVRLLLTVGLRVAEVCSTNVSDLGRERGHRTITVIRKGSRHQRLAIPMNTAAVLDRYIGGRKSGPLFLGDNGERMTRRQVAYRLERLGRRAGIEKKVTPHVLRHTTATSALDAGASLRDVQTLLGHIDPRTTNRYDRTRHNLDRSPVHLLDRPLPTDMTRH